MSLPICWGKKKKSRNRRAAFYPWRLSLTGSRQVRVSQLMEALDTPGERDSEKGRPLEAAVLLRRVKPATPVFLKFSSDYIYQQNPLLFIIMVQISSTVLSLVCGVLQYGVTFSSLSSPFCSPLPWASSLPLWQDLQFPPKMGQNLDHSLRPGINVTSLRSFSRSTKTHKGSPSPEALEHTITLFPAF